ncbi:hypothetical protein WR25_11859 [Diploscapter pachys]|uniref:CDP-diacylglycerol--glycerol-3-phosphate 3-phosphatidyltransferase n=1 Tax=Diploscapter pachys TaxID=2018661 RepID=A0A2A2L1R5_9BILA|nr:hypothetical protein WR25_11859 [Diploscapter pachys]
MEYVENLPSVPINAKNVKIISEPEDFYETLLTLISKSNERIYISSLYLGDGKLENALVDKIDNRLRDVLNLRVTILLDYLRGTRGERLEKSSTTLLKRIADRSTIYLYHTPYLKGFLKQTIPERSNEVIGLQHMKLYIFDDHVLLSGANLSDSYFTNRQDRYILFENSKELADYFSQVVDVVGQLSFVLDKDGQCTINPLCPIHPVTGNTKEFSRELNDRLKKVMESLRSASPSHSQSDTVAYPILQMGMFEVEQEHQLMKRLLSTENPSMKFTMASGYFNCLEEYEDLMTNKGKYDLDILVASPKANGFLNAQGLSGQIPAVYSNILHNFYSKVQESNRKSLKLFEYDREGWTFHSKGFWIEHPNYSATIVGSSNYGYRSAFRDLEAQVFLVTKDQNLREQLKEMVLIPTGLMVAREVWKNVNRKPAQVVRTSSMFTPSQSRELPRRRHQASEATTSKVNPFERKELLARIGGTSVRNLCSKQAEEEKPEPLEKLLKDEKWSIIYRYPDIVKFVLIARFKLMQTVGSVIVIPYMSYLFANTETISPTFYFSTVVAGIVAPLMLIVMSKYLTRIVGVISINETNE